MINYTYMLEYTYYQYNSGLSDNGVYSKKIELSYQKALELFERIKKDIENTKNNQNIEYDDMVIDEELRNDLIPYEGYFLKVELFLLKKELILSHQ